MERISEKNLINLLESIDPYVPGRVHMVAIGGTALTLLGIKESTLDIDSNLPREEDTGKIRALFEELGFEKVNRNKWISPNGLIIDLYDQDYIFCVQLMESSIETSTPVRELKHISLKALNLYDIIVTKLARCEDKDMEDILAIFRKREIDLERLSLRYRKTMELSVARDAKENILLLFNKLDSKGIAEIDKNLLRGVEGWNP